MSVIYTDSELKENQKYIVQDVTKLSRDTKRFIGLPAIFAYPNNSTAHVRITGNMQTVPVRALINIKGFVAKGVRAENADAFAVIAQNNLGIPVGRAFIGVDGLTSTHAIFLIDGKELRVPLDILASFVRVKEKVTKEVKKAAKKSGIPVEVVALLDSPEDRQDIEEIPSAIMKMFPNLNVKDLKETLYKQEGVFLDYHDNIHETLQEADRANAVIRHKILEAKLIELAEKNLKASFKEARVAELNRRKGEKK